jgi:hypothetical protein
MLKCTWKILGWLAVLLVGLYLISFLTFHTGLSGAGTGTGIFSYSFRAFCDVMSERENEGSAFGSIFIEAKLPPRFMVWGQSSPKYRNAEITWTLLQKEKSKGKATIDLERMLIITDDKSASLTTKTLSALLGIAPTTARDTILVERVAELLRSAGDGKLPVPNHHGYSLPEPFIGYMQHYALGFWIRPLGLVWVAIWSAFGIYRLIITKRLKRNAA